MNRPWMPLYIGDFIADTAHLGATETGIYIRLIMHCWQHGTIPRDDKKLALISHVDSRLWHKWRETVLQFFDTVDASTMQHKRVSAELLRAEEISNKRKDAAKQMHSKNSANAEQVHTQLQLPKNDIPSKEGYRSLSAGFALESTPAKLSEQQIYALQQKYYLLDLGQLLPEAAANLPLTEAGGYYQIDQFLRQRQKAALAAKKVPRPPPALKAPPPPSKKKSIPSYKV